MRISGISGGWPPSSSPDPFSQAKGAIVEARAQYELNPQAEKKIRQDLIGVLETFQARFDWDNQLTKALAALQNQNFDFKTALNKAASDLKINSWQSL